MKVIFLDHQGVMYVNKHPNPGTLVDFDKDNIYLLNKILKTDENIEIIISSDWKYWVSIDEMRDFYRRQGIIKLPISYTKKTNVYNLSNYGEQRANEIKNYLESTTNITHWVSIDDIDMSKYLDNFVHIRQPTIGLKQEGIYSSILKYL
jgi:hypothetical protein